MLRNGFLMLLVALVATGTASADESAVLWGLVVDGRGNPAGGYSVVIQDAVGGASWTSPPSTPTGEYQVSVPLGSSYRAVAVLSRGGARFSLDAGVPVQARRPVRYRLDVILPGTAPTSAAPTEPTSRAPAATGPGADDRGPWWKSPGGITALVAVHGAILAVILMNNQDETVASPSTP